MLGSGCELWDSRVPVDAPAPELFTRRDALALALVISPLALLYALTLCPTVWWYDSAEFAARAASLSPAHAPGYPAYLLLAHPFTYIGPEPAHGTNLMSALFGLGSVAAAYALARLMEVRESLAAICAFGLGTSEVLWANSVITEVYSTGLCFTLSTFCLLVAGQVEARWRLIVAASAVAGLGVGMHMSLLTCGLGFVLLAAAAGMDADRDWPGLARVFTLQQWRRRSRLALYCLLGLVVGLSAYWIFPLIEFDNILSRGEWRRWGSLISGKVFRPKFVEATAETKFGARNLEVMRMQLGWPGLGLGLAGLLAALVRRPLLGLGLGLGAAGNAWLFWNYRVHDIEVFFLPAAALGFVFAGYAVERAAAWLEARRDSADSAGHIGLIFAGLLALWPLSTLPQTYAKVDASEATEARDYAQMLVRELPPDALFVLYNHPEEWKHYAVLLYTRRALGELQDVRVVTRPDLDKLDEKLAAGVQVFAFRDVKRVRKRVDLERDGELLRVVRTNHKLRRKSKSKSKKGKK